MDRRNFIKHLGATASALLESEMGSANLAPEGGEAAVRGVKKVGKIVQFNPPYSSSLHRCSATYSTVERTVKGSINSNYPKRG